MGEGERDKSVEARKRFIESAEVKEQFLRSAERFIESNRAIFVESEELISLGETDSPLLSRLVSERVMGSRKEYNESLIALGKLMDIELLPVAITKNDAVACVPSKTETQGKRNRGE